MSWAYKVHSRLKSVSQLRPAPRLKGANFELLLQHCNQTAANDFYKRFIESLYFPDIHARQEEIAEAHRQTFEWIFDKPGLEAYLWHDFVDWLESGNGIYWICGKAGSGKSTLMSFICQDSRTETALKIWSGTNAILVPSFFFWNAGTELQKSSRGLLRSLIYQILENVPNLMPVLEQSPDVSQHITQQLPTWTERRLRATLHQLLCAGLNLHCLCIFIDGLDELSDNQDSLLELIRGFRQYPGVKICLSSRPHQSFRDEYGSSAMLELQDLTEPDIRRYVSDKLGRAPLKASQVACSSFGLKDTVDTIVYKAEGVFLWVNLAVRDQIEGIKNGDDAEQLRERLQLLPKEIEKLYVHMLQRIDICYRKEVAQYLQLVFCNDESLSLFEIALAVHKRIDDILVFSPDISIGDVRNHCEFIGERVATTCKGFLEVREFMDGHEWQKTVTERFLKSVKDRKTPLEQRGDIMKTKFYHLHTRINFLHRTALDFFKDNEEGKSFLEANPSVNPHPHVLNVKASLAELIVFPLSTDDREVRNLIDRIMDNASIAEDNTGVAQTALMELLDRSITILCRRSLSQPTNLHWCRAWEIFEFSNSSWALDRTRPLSRSKSSQTSGRRDDGVPAPCPVDFLGFAAWHGLHNHVAHTLDLRSGRPHPSTEDYLLGCVVDGLGRPFRRHLRGHLELVSALLKRGADPNMRTSSRSVWGSFLLIMHRTWFLNNSSVDAGWVKALRAFLGSGANVNERISSKFIYGFGDREVSRSRSSSPFRMTEISMWLDLSASSVIQQYFATSSEFSEFEKDALIASGASWYSECTKVFLKVGQGEDRRRVDSTLSKQQLSQFWEVLNQRLKASPGDDSMRCGIIKRQVMELVQKLDMEQLYQQAPREEEFEEGSLSEEQSQEDESSEDIESISDGSSIDASDSDTFEAEGPSDSADFSQEEERMQRPKQDD